MAYRQYGDDIRIMFFNPYESNITCAFPGKWRQMTSTKPRWWLGGKQAITWASIYPDLCRRMASLDHNALSNDLMGHVWAHIHGSIINDVHGILCILWLMVHLLDKAVQWYRTSIAKQIHHTVWEMFLFIQNYIKTIIMKNIAYCDLNAFCVADQICDAICRLNCILFLRWFHIWKEIRNYICSVDCWGLAKPPSEGWKGSHAIIIPFVGNMISWNGPRHISC